MEHNPYYDESLGQAHFDPNLHLRLQQSQWLQQQEDARIHQIAMGSTQQDFSRLQGVSQQVSPQHHGGGIPWGGVAAGAVAGYMLANRQQAPERPRTPRIPQRAGVWGWYVLLGVIVHLTLWVAFSSPEAYIGGAEFWLIGTAVWIPVWFVTYLHQSRTNRYNDSLRKAASPRED